MVRLKKIRIIQILLLLSGLIIIYFTYYAKNTEKNTGLISEKIKNEIIKKSDSEDTKNVFFNIKYNGIDLSGNRYILTSEEAVMKKENENLLDLKGVNYVFYLKDGTILKVSSKLGLYNNKTLDMKFRDKVLMTYDKSTLEADNAEYSNSGNYLKINNSVKVKSDLGNVFADELFFDLQSKKLNINSFENNNIKANIKIDEKRF
tara:strand:- start:31 stop:642 length:612 start_codon:yes stop_codon:yes gene_type:complete